MCAQSRWLMQLLRIYSASYYSFLGPSTVLACIVLEVDVYFLCNADEDLMFFISPREAVNCKGLDASQHRCKRLSMSVQG